MSKETIQTKVKARHCGNDLRPWNYIKLVWEQGFTCARMFMSAAPCKWHANLLPNFALTPNVMLVDRIPSKWRAISAAFWGWLANTKTHDELNLPENRWFSNILYILLKRIEVAVVPNLGVLCNAGAEYRKDGRKRTFRFLFTAFSQRLRYVLKLWK